MLILDKEISRSELSGIAEGLYGDIVKGVVDVERGNAEDLIEYDSLINIRPRQGNNSRDVENPETRKTIEAIVLRYIRE